MSDAQVRRIEEELRKKTMILEELETFIMEYSFQTKELYIDPVKEKYIKVAWDKQAILDKKIDHMVYRPDIPAAKSLLDFTKIDKESPTMYTGGDYSNHASDISGNCSGKRKSAVLRIFTDNHKYAWFRLTRIVFLNEEKKPDKIVVLFTNIDEKAETEQNLKFYAEKDILTHLPNITAFLAQAQFLIDNNADEDYEIVRMDIDRFRVISGMFGIEEGNNLLKFIAVKIQERLDEEDEVAYCRIASDIFAMCIPVKKYSVEEFIESLCRAVSAYPKNYEVTLAFGRYQVTKQDREQKVPVSNLIDRAAAAQATIKGNYLIHTAFYDENIRQHEEAESMILSDMYTALREEQFQVFLQPKVEMGTGKIIGSEALVRWLHPKRGMISPADFIPIFEKNGFIMELDKYMIKHTCKIIRKWLDEGTVVYPVSVNLSRVNLYNTKLIQNIEDYVNEYQVPREYISFELTESAFSADNSYMKMLAAKLQTKHFKVLMDDFGSGYSSLNTLKEIPVDILKIDLKFLSAGSDNERANLIIKHVVEMANDLGLFIVVEGVENKEQVRFLLDIGCRVAQGFYYYRPITVEEYEKNLN